MTVRIYRWDDASAPTLDGSAAGHRLIDVLDKCLVAGYGSKTAAGWTKEFTGTGKAVFKQGTGSNGMRLRVDSSSSGQFPRVRGYEVMTAVDTGTGQFPEEYQYAGGLYINTSSTTDTTQRPWLLAATEKMFYLWIGFDQATVNGLTSSTYKPVLCFGDITSFKSGDAYHTLLIANTTGAQTTNGFATTGNVGATATGNFLARSFTQIGASAYASKCVNSPRGSGATVFGTGGGPYPDPVTGGLLLDPVYVGESSIPCTRGILPGVWNVLHNMPGQSGDVIPGTGAFSGKTFLLLDCANGSSRGRFALEISDTW